jgi:hypothetical protein
VIFASLGLNISSMELKVAVCLYCLAFGVSLAWSFRKAVKARISVTPLISITLLLALAIVIERFKNEVAVLSLFCVYQLIVITGVILFSQGSRTSRPLRALQVCGLIPFASWLLFLIFIWRH